MNKFLSILFLICAQVSFAQSLYFPPNTSNQWDTISPSSLGYCDQEINDLIDFLDNSNSKAFILLKNGKIVLEHYFDDFSSDSLWYWASAGKTLTSTLVGIAQENNLLSINDTSSKYLGTGWTNCTPVQENQIKVYHQLSMTTGLNDQLTDPDCTDPVCLQYKADAGSRWAYHNGPYTLLDKVIETASNQTLNQYFNSSIGTKIGMNGAYFPVGSNNVFISKPRSMARFGLLLLAEGKWDNTTVLGDTSYFNQMTSSSQNLNHSYGYLTWLNGQSSFMVPQLQIVFPGSINKDAPSEMFAALGKNGQLINVSPQDSIVWIRMGEDPAGQGGLVGPNFNNEIWAKINKLKCVPTNISSLKPNQINWSLVQNTLRIQSKNLIREVSIYNSVGQLTHISSIPSKEPQVGLENRSGLYIVHLIFENGTQQTFKFVHTPY